mgnify:CR=1 FL=1
MNEKIFLQKIKDEFPKLEWKKYKFLDHGWDHFAIILDDKIVFRTTKGVSKDVEGLLYDETRLLKYLKNKISVGIPNYTYISKDKSIAGYNILGGKELSPSKFKKINSTDKEKIAKQLANFITFLHSTPKSAVKKFNVPVANPKKDYLDMVLNAKKLIFPKLNKKEIAAIEKFFTELKTTLDYDGPNVLIHTDLKWEHLLWNSKKKKLNIIDFSDREFGDPAIDFTSFWAFGYKFTKRVYELYRGKKDAEFLNRSKLYFKKIPILVMQGVIEGYPLSFKNSHKMFRQRFKI